MLRMKALVCVCAAISLLASAAAQESTNSVTPQTNLPNKNLEAKQTDARLKVRVLTDAARADMENGRIEEAERKLRSALELDSSHRPASYYLTLIQERKAARRKANVQQIDASVQPIYPMIKKYDGTLQYGVPVHRVPLRDIAKDLNGR